MKESISGAFVGEIARGLEIGKTRNIWYVWAKCPRCGKQRWITQSGVKKRSPDSCYCKQCASVGRSKCLKFE